MFDKFSDRHIGVTNPEDLKAMLAVIGVKSVDELIAQVIPQSIRLKQPLALPQGMSEYEFANHIQALAAKNRTLRSFIGMGYYPCAVPAAITRNVFENPAWYTSYTPYQAEISQGRLEALLNFQTAVISLTGMEIGNCSLLDEGTAAAEAMLMMFSLRSREAVKEGRNQLFVDRNIFPQTLDVLITRSEPFGIELVIDDYNTYEFTGKEFGAIVQYPAANGEVRDYAAFTEAAHAKGALVTAVADLLSLALLKAPGEWGADIVVGTTQRLGIPMGFGGPSAGYMTTREAYKRNMPGRIIGVSIDRLGNRALRMALQTREQHRSEPFGIELVIDDYNTYEFTGKEFGAIVQYPAANGEVRDYAAFTEAAHAKGALVTAVADLLSLALLKAPGEWGADIVVGTTQRLGIPMGFGGPSAGYMTTREAYKRNMPGRIIGVSIDRLGNRALRMALQTREQHIKRERATSNICTATALMASMVGFYCVYNGAEGLRRSAKTAHTAAVTVAKALEAMDYKLAAKNFFDTLEVEAEAAVVQSLALERGINFFYPSEDRVRFSFDDVTTPEEVNEVIAIFAEAKGKKAKAVKLSEEITIPAAILRQSEFLTERVFNTYRCESDLMRYIKRLELRDISLANSMISLGSCTMKLNAAALMQPLSLAGFQNMHPFAPADQTEGYRELIDGLAADLATITGFAACSLMPNSGAAGEYTGLMVIRAYHQSRGQGYRNIVLIPSSAHGTNPASAAMAGMKIVTVGCDANGNIDVEDLKAKAQEHSSELACMMITYPSTHGVFESRIREIVDAVHDAGGQVYMDGANMNAQVGLTNPGYIGADVCHLNLHKTFAMPHGGGGPGVGPICVAEHLRKFLPSHSIVPTGGDEGITAVASAPWGSAMLFPITYGYIKMLGGEGLKAATEMAIVNANYMSSALKSEYRTYYSGETGRVGHEMILDLTHFKKDYNIDCGDIAHRLMDYGFHAPTLSFPVHETLMVEPTESEPKAEMDRFIATLIQIKRECEEAAASGEADNVVVNAPHTAAEICGEWSHPYTREKAVFPLDFIRESKFFPYVSKIDNGYGDRNLVCRCTE